MAALCSRRGHYILQPWFLSFFLLFFLAYSQRSEIGCLPYFHTWCGLSANLECMSEMCCMRPAKNTWRKTSAKNRHLSIIAQFCWAIFSQKACINKRKKLVKHQYLVHMCSECSELRPTNGWDRLGSLGTPVNFDGFHVLAALLQRRRSTEVNQTLHDVWPSPGLLHYIYTFLGAHAP